MIRSGNGRRGGCGWRRVRPRAAGRVGVGARPPGGAHDDRTRSRYATRVQSLQILGVYLDLPQDSVAPAKPALEGRSVRRARSAGGARYGFMPAETSTSRGMINRAAITGRGDVPTRSSP